MTITAVCFQSASSILAKKRIIITQIICIIRIPKRSYQCFISWINPKLMVTIRIAMVKFLRHSYLKQSEFFFVSFISRKKFDWLFCEYLLNTNIMFGPLSHTDSTHINYLSRKFHFSKSNQISERFGPATVSLFLWFLFTSSMKGKHPSQTTTMCKSRRWYLVRFLLSACVLGIVY